MNTDEIAFVPVATGAGHVRHQHAVPRIMVRRATGRRSPPPRRRSRAILKQRHEGEEDVTIITQDAVLADLRPPAQRADARGGRHRRDQPGRRRHPGDERDAGFGRAAHAEIGLMKALGATPALIRGVFLAEAVMLSAVGALIGLALGIERRRRAARRLPRAARPTRRTGRRSPASVTALATGLVFGVLPAQRAAAARCRCRPWPNAESTDEATRPTRFRLARRCRLPDAQLADAAGHRAWASPRSSC